MKRTIKPRALMLHEVAKRRYGDVATMKRAVSRASDFQNILHASDYDIHEFRRRINAVISDRNYTLENLESFSGHLAAVMLASLPNYLESYRK